MSDDHSRDYNYEDPLAIVSLLVAVAILGLFINNRGVFPIAQREPLLAALGGALYQFDVSMWLFAQQHPNIPLIAGRFLLQWVAGMVLVVYLIRVFKLYLDGGITHERVTNSHKWFIAHRHWRSRAYLARFALGLVFCHTVLFLIGVFTVKPLSDVIYAPSRDGDKAKSSGLLIAGVAIVYFLTFVFFAFKLRGINDGFRIKQELKLGGGGNVVIVGGWMLKTAFNLPCAVPSCSALILWAVGVWVMLTSIVYPLALATKDPRFSWMPRSGHELSKHGAETHSIQSSADGDFPDYEHGEGESSSLAAPPAPVRQASARALERLKRVPLAKFLTYPIGREAFRRFTVLEFSVENLLFVEAVQQLRLQSNPNKEDAQLLIDRFVAEAAPNQVNLPSSTVKKLMARMEEGGQGDDYKAIFDEAYDNIMKLMQRDAYKRFQRSPEWEQHVLVFDAERESALTDKIKLVVAAEPSSLPPVPENPGHAAVNDSMDSATTPVASIEPLNGPSERES